MKSLSDRIADLTWEEAVINLDRFYTSKDMQMSIHKLLEADTAFTFILRPPIEVVTWRGKRYMDQVTIIVDGLDLCRSVDKEKEEYYRFYLNPMDREDGEPIYALDWMLSIEEGDRLFNILSNNIYGQL